MRSQKLAKLFFVLIATLAPLDFAVAENEVYSAGISEQSSDRYNGNFFQVGLESPINDDTRLGVSFEHLHRKYSNETKADDSSFALTAARSFGEGLYFESKVQHSADAEIMPSTLAAFTQHKVVARNDFGLGLEFRSYARLNAGSIRPSVRHEFSDELALSASSVIARTDSTLVAYQADIFWKSREHQTLRVYTASGRTLEDAGVSANFNSLTGSYSFAFERTTVGFEISRYVSDLRSETSIGAKIEFR